MIDPLDYPLFVFALSFVAQVLSAWAGASFLRRRLHMEGDTREAFGVIEAATLTLLGLIIGFSFSMATGRYDQRKNYEEAEANAIGTEFVRADLLPTADAAKVRVLLSSYLDERVQFYSAYHHEHLQEINTRTAKLQNELWTAVQTPAVALPTPVTALVVAGMNDVLNSQGYTQAAWWNRIPFAAWFLMAGIAICANVLVGFGAQSSRSQRLLLVILPFVVSIAFLLIADIDSPRGGLIRVHPQNLISLAQSMHAQ